MREWWKTSPALRFFVRTVVVAVAGYAVTAFQQGITDWRSFLGGLAAAGITAVVGLVTPVEPFVGVNKTDGVQVPTPPAVPEQDFDSISAARGKLASSDPEEAALLGQRVVHRPDE